jgi:hypothetical protein
MRLPFLQVPQLDLSRGRTMARILRIPEAHGIGLTVALDAWAVDEAPDGDVSGLIRDPAPAEAVALAVGWDGSPEQLLAALVRVRLVEETDAGPCVVSVRRYESALKSPTRRSAHAKHAAEQRWHGKSDAPSIASAMPDDAYTQTQTQTQTQKEAEAFPPASQAAPRVELRLEPPASPRRAAKKQGKPEKPADPRHAALVQQLVEACREVTGRPYRFAGGQDAVAVAALLASADQDPDTRGELAPAEVVRRWKIGLAWRWGNGEAPVQDLGTLNKRWQSCASTATAPPQRLSSGQTMSDFTKVLGEDLG